MRHAAGIEWASHSHQAWPIRWEACCPFAPGFPPGADWGTRMGLELIRVLGAHGWALTTLRYIRHANGVGYAESHIESETECSLSAGYRFSARLYSGYPRGVDWGTRRTPRPRPTPQPRRLSEHCHVNCQCFMTSSQSKVI